MRSISKKQVRDDVTRQHLSLLVVVVLVSQHTHTITNSLEIAHFGRCHPSNTNQIHHRHHHQEEDRVSEGLVGEGGAVLCSFIDWFLLLLLVACLVCLSRVRELHIFISLV